MADGNPTLPPLGVDVFEDDLDTRTAHAREMVVVGLTGRGGGKMADYCTENGIAILASLSELRIAKLTSDRTLPWPFSGSAIQ